MRCAVTCLVSSLLLASPVPNSPSRAIAEFFSAVKAKLHTFFVLNELTHVLQGLIACLGAEMEFVCPPVPCDLLLSLTGHVKGRLRD